jgi:hypothetical protein
VPEFLERWSERNLDTRIPSVRTPFQTRRQGRAEKENSQPQGTTTLSEESPALPSPEEAGLFLGASDPRPDATLNYLRRTPTPVQSTSDHPRQPSSPVSILACAPGHRPPPLGRYQIRFIDPRERTPMPQSTPNTQHPRKWALALRREILMAIGQGLRVECELPEDLPRELTMLRIRRDREHDPYADIVGTC